MKPLEENPFYKPSPIQREKAKEEIREFLDHSCEFAELPIIRSDKSFTTNLEDYKRACRVLRVSDQVELRTSKGRIIACKKNIR